ncbi:MAG: putative quinol monooxygenase [Pyrinomonadaceae bacterium]
MLSFSMVPAVSAGSDMYGLIGKMIAIPGKRDELIKLLLAGSGDMPGCLSYVVAKDLSNENAIWITEVWADKASHQDSLQLPAVREAISKARPLIAGFDTSHTTEPVGGLGLKVPKR